MSETTPINPFRPDQDGLDKNEKSFLEQFAGATEDELKAAGIGETGNGEGEVSRLAETNSEENSLDANQFATAEERAIYDNELTECAGIEVTRKQEKQIQKILKNINADRIESGLDEIELGRKIKIMKILIGNKTKEELRQTLIQKNIFIGDNARRVFNRDDFSVQPDERNIILFYFKIGNISLSGLRTITEINNKVQEWGMGLCPEEVAPRLCIEFNGKAFGESINVGMKEFVDDEEQVFIFCCERRGNSMILDGDWASRQAKWHQTSEFVFCLPDE